MSKYGCQVRLLATTEEKLDQCVKLNAEWCRVNNVEPFEVERLSRTEQVNWAVSLCNALLREWIAGRGPGGKASADGL